MTLYDFRLLNDAEQIDWLYKEGIYIGKRKEGSITIMLYQIDSFYVEIKYRIYRYKVQSIRCFSSAVVVEPYLEQINIENLVGVK